MLSAHVLRVRSALKIGCGLAGPGFAKASRRRADFFEQTRALGHPTRSWAIRPLDIVIIQHSVMQSEGEEKQKSDRHEETALEGKILNVFRGMEREPAR